MILDAKEFQFLPHVSLPCPDANYVSIQSMEGVTKNTEDAPCNVAERLSRGRDLISTNYRHKNANGIIDNKFFKNEKHSAAIHSNVT